MIAEGDYGRGAPVRLKINGSTVAREYKPQFYVEIDEGLYYKAVYDVTPLVSRKLLEKSDHRLGVFYEHLRPLRVSDACLLAIFESQRASFSISYYTGAVSVQPGDVFKVNARLPGLIKGSRRALIGLHIPSSRSNVKLVAGGSDPLIVAGPGFIIAEIKIPYKGPEVPVAVLYEKPETSVYPKTVILTDIAVIESLYPEPLLEVSIIESRVDNEKVAIRGLATNSGAEAARDVRVSIISLGVKLAESGLGDLEPGAGMEFELSASKSPLARLSIRVEWVHLGLKYSKTIEFTTKQHNKVT